VVYCSRAPLKHSTRNENKAKRPYIPIRIIEKSSFKFILDGWLGVENNGGGMVGNGVDASLFKTFREGEECVQRDLEVELYEGL